MSAVTGELPPDDGRWAFEPKWDGMRAVVEVDHGAVTAVTRTGKDVVVAFPELLDLDAATSGTDAADEVSKFFVGPLLDFHRRLIDEGVAAGEFRAVDPVLFYTSVIGACDHLFYGRHAMQRAAGIGPVDEDVCRDFVAHMEAMTLGGMLKREQ